ncbi:MAG: muramidase [Sphingobacteriales bacterium SCN 48-20]|jgi:Bax protein|nr:glucosaminidase domain-containing protein [Terrimonas ferruginea]ODT90812.1 MAG: muramidase [Sphingobacteriales bacterium SCN 48-20]OJW44457.1 MAG: muramidase [Sphingobacteriales bacterium 48-107]
MLPFRRTFIFLGLLALMVLTVPARAQKAYISNYRPLADSLSAVYGIPSSVILAVAIVESGAGTTRNARLLNNHFGIVGSNRLQKTHGIRTRYKQYPSVAASYAAFCQLVARRKFYPKLKGEKDYRKWVEAISKTGYSERPAEWRKKIITAIQRNKLAN